MVSIPNFFTTFGNNFFLNALNSTNFSPLLKLIKRTPCVLRPTKEISSACVRTNVPLSLINIISSPGKDLTLRLQLTISFD